MDEIKKERRRKGSVARLKPRMLELEAEGKSRKEIAIELQLTPCQVTITLGAVKPYLGKRIVV